MGRRWVKYILGMAAGTVMCLPLLHAQGSQPVDTTANAPQIADSTARSNVTPPKVRARITPDSISIGDHFTLELTIDKDLVQQIGFPEFKERKLNEQIEVLAEGTLDTLKQDGRKVELSKKYVLTTFEEGIHAIGHFPLLWMDKNIVDTIYSVDSLALLVTTFEVDTVNQTIYDIKPLVKAPFHPYETIGYHAGYIFLLRPILIAIAAILLFRRKRRLSLTSKLGPKEPAHVVAIRNLEILHNQKLWQNKKHKFYYTRLTDILREYIEGRYDVGAMEMTSEEIMDALSQAGIPQKYYAGLNALLREADLVKFAKYVPEDEENEKVYYDAYYFIENTKPSEVEEVPAGENDELKPYE